MKKKLDLVAWFIIWLLPVFAWLLCIFRSGTAATDFGSFMYDWSFWFVRDLINSIWSVAFSETLYIAPFISYLVSVEIVHCLFDALIFIPRFAHEVVERATLFAGGEKK